jgi:hypothetical protein
MRIDEPKPPQVLLEMNKWMNSLKGFNLTPQSLSHSNPKRILARNDLRGSWERGI